MLIMSGLRGFASRWALTHLSHDGAQSNTVTTPEFLDMVPWYSGYVRTTLPSYTSCLTHPRKIYVLKDRETGGVAWVRTSADLFKTAFDLLVSVTLFLGRFDMRTMQVRCCCTVGAYAIFDSPFYVSNPTTWVMVISPRFTHPLIK